MLHDGGVRRETSADATVIREDDLVGGVVGILNSSAQDRVGFALGATFQEVDKELEYASVWSCVHVAKALHEQKT